MKKTIITAGLLVSMLFRSTAQETTQEDAYEKRIHSPHGEDLPRGWQRTKADVWAATPKPESQEGGESV